MKKIISKLMASIATVAILSGYISILGNCAIVLAADNLNSQTSATNEQNVEFDAYFKEESNKTYTTQKNINAENSIYFNVLVKNNGYLKNATIQLSDANYSITETENENIQLIEGNKIILNQINNENSYEIEVPIVFNNSNVIDITQFNKESEVIFSAEYVEQDGSIKQISKTIKLQLKWTADAKVEINQTMDKYIPYDINGEKGIILQTLVTSKITDNSLPVKETKIEITVPSINGIKPTQVTVSANTTLATNGDKNATTFSKENYIYNEEESKVTITVKNEGEKITWEKDAQDEYVVTYRFSEDALEKLSEGLQVSLNTTAIIIAYAGTELNLEANNSNTVTITDSLSQIVTTNTNIPNEIIKSYLLSGIQETEYTQQATIDVAYAELVDSINLTLEPTNLVMQDSSIVDAKPYTYLKNLKINKAKFIEIFGEDGALTIKTKENYEIATINKDSQVDENGDINIDTTNLNINIIQIETSKPQSEGMLNIEVDSAIKAITDISTEYIEKIQVNSKVQAKNGETLIAENTNTAEQTFILPTMNVQISGDKQTLISGAENNIALTAVLHTANIEDMLFTNPTLEIELPEYIENISISSVELMFNDELTIRDYYIQDNGTNKKIIININGTQTKYDLGLVSGGANITVNATLKVKDLIPTQSSQITLRVSNNSKLRTLTNQATATMDVKTESPAGIVTTNKISNYNQANDEVTSVNGEVNIGTLDLQSLTTQNAKVQNIVMNNNGVAAKNISVLGRTMSTGNKNIVTQESLGTTFDAPMNSEITVSGVNGAIIYYSENADATIDLEEQENGWTLTPTDLSKVKSYLVTIDTMNVGDIATIEYGATIPADLSRGNSAYAIYAVYYTSENAASMDRVLAPITGVTTGEGPEIVVDITSNVGNNIQVQEGQIITYAVTVKNIGNVTAKGIIIGANVPENTTYVQYVAGTTGNSDSYVENTTKTKATKAITSLEPNQTQTFEFDVKVNSETQGKQITTKAFATADEISNLIYSNDISNQIVEGYLNVSMVTEPGISTTLKANSTLKYITTIENITEEEQKNVVITDVLPEGVRYKEAYYVVDSEKTTSNINYNESERKVTINIDTLSAELETYIYIIVEIEENAYDITSVSNYMQVQYNEDGQVRTVATNKITNNVLVEKAELVASLTSNVPEGNIETGESISYILEIKNTGTKLLEDIQISTVLPDGLKYISSKYEIEGIESIVGGGTSDENGEPVELTANISAGKTLKYTITALVEDLSDENSKNIEFSVKVSQTEIGEITTNTLKHTIVVSGQTNTENNGNNSNSETENNGQTGGDLTGTRKIQGTVWIDANNNGQKESTEQRVSGVQVMLYNYATGNLVSDGEGKAVVITTGENGQYEFTKLTEGTYSVIFKYDSAKYSATEYQKADVDSIVNSDAVDTRIRIDGEEFVAGLTEKIELSTLNEYNVDLGLVENPKFDLSLTKAVTAVTVQNPTGTATYQYDSETLAKRELIGKYVSQTTIVVEYTFTVKNEGAVAGYAKKIVDYLPSSLQFNAELNRDWYQGQDGQIYTSSLSNTKIEPGEEKQITLYLSKKLTDNSLGIINNTAEIYETYNEEGLTDFDSTPGNKASNEDDFASADLILSVRTGAETMLIVIITTIGIIAIIGAGAYHARKMVLRRI